MNLFQFVVYVVVIDVFDVLLVSCLEFLVLFGFRVCLLAWMTVFVLFCWVFGVFGCL